MADEWTNPPMQEGEKETLLAFLNELRQAVMRNLEGLDNESGRRQLVPSGTCLVGIVRHLCDVENYWVRFIFARERDIPFYDDPWTGDLDVDEAARRYTATWSEVDRVIAAASSLDELAARGHGEDGKASLRWILVHLLEETARHAGQADILREQIDGTTGR